MDSRDSFDLFICWTFYCRRRISDTSEEFKLTGKVNNLSDERIISLWLKGSAALRLEQVLILSLKQKKSSKAELFIVGMRGFEPPLSRPPDEHFNRTKLHPDGHFSERRQI